MKNLANTFVFVVFACHFSSFAQEKPMEKEMAVYVKSVNISKNASAGKIYQDCLNKILGDQYLLSKNALIWLEPFTGLSETKVIEGMDTYTFVTMETGFVLKNSLLNEEITWSTNIKGKGENESSAIANSMKSICSDKKIKSEIEQFINDYITQLSFSKCDQTIAAIKQFKADKHFDKALIALDYIGNDSLCTTSKNNLEAELLNEQKDYACDKIIQETSVMAHSGIAEQLNRAVYLLVKIPPEASCANEAVELAKVIGEKNEKLNVSARAQLDRQIIILNQNKQSEWRNEYRNQIYYE